MHYKTVLIDDEPLAISRLKRLLSKFEDVFEIIDTAGNGQEGLEKIETLKPDLIFLDIEMPLLNGFEMLEQLDTVPKVIFCTAYDQYAIQAFEENSLDYLLKPVEKERLQKTVDKLKSLEKKDNGFDDTALAKLLSQVNKKKTIHSITVKKGDKIFFIPLTDISYFHAEDKYVFLNTNDGKQYLTSYTITSLDEKLPEEFIRISRSAIIHTHRIASLEKSFNGKFVVNLNDLKKTKLESGTSYGDNLKQLMEV
ncbi:LytR/AlgR family response regulator transcription factor [Jiulongibacter sediminis]|uniref:Regulator n=1 Tax=Jiulongibacter sediminis TaxID=1605367 RepID=A0A0P7BA56_9BACT|nr:LytTR family DNA-binding domain-containing protein [Jiulongibacter sediminis]KPM47223.1 regulator [Jiulongibacter sediminis]TBX22782.1 regulator [Jiulongibacter sediminis]